MVLWNDRPARQRCVIFIRSYYFFLPASSAILDLYSFRSSSTLFRPSAMKASNFSVNLAMRSRKSSKPKFMFVGRVSAAFCCCCCCWVAAAAAAVVDGGCGIIIIDWRMFVPDSVVSYMSDILFASCVCNGDLWCLGVGAGAKR